MIVVPVHIDVLHLTAGSRNCQLGDALKKVQSGERLRIPARTFNTFIDAARDFEARQRNQKQDPTRRVSSSGIVPLENASTNFPSEWTLC